MAAAAAAAAPRSAPKPKARKSNICASCQGPFRIPVVFKGQKFCRFCFSHLQKEGLTIIASPKEKSEGKSPTESKEESPFEEGQGLCGEHGQALLWFCPEERAPICEACRASGRHESHSVVPVEEAARKYQEKLRQAEYLIKQHLQESLKLKYLEGKKTAEWKNKIHSQKENIEDEFFKLYSFLEDEEERLLKRLKEEERQTLKKLHSNLAQLSKQRSSLKQLVSEIEKKRKQPAIELLKDVEHVLRRSENVTLQEMEAVPTELKNVYNIPCVDMIEILTRFKVDVCLDPTTAHPSLIVSEDRKSVRHGGPQQKQLPDSDNAERFDTYVMVLGSKSFTSGRYYWEVEVGDSSEWDLGVCRESVSRKGQVIIFSPISGFWRLWLRNGDEYKALISCPVLLPMSMKPTRVGIFLDYSQGEVSFYNVTERTHIYTYVGTFYGPLRPFFSPSRQHKGKNACPLLSICPGPTVETSKSKEQPQSQNSEP